MTLTDYRTIGRSGLVASPLALGTMTFGTGRWGSTQDVSRAVFDAYVDAGGNMVDTADVYSGGRSEEMLGGFIAERRLRERIVLATKAGFAREAGNPNAGGNGAKNIRAALDGSLRRLRTDFVDLFWIHVWDMVTPAEEMLRTLGDLVRDGRVRYFGLSNVPAWYAAKMATLAAVHGVPGPVALQMEYSLAERGIEREHLPAAREFGLGILPWSPLAGGFLTGKYRRVAPESSAPERGASGGGRLSGGNPFGDTKFTQRNWTILEALRAIAAETGRKPAQVALAWACGRPGVSTPILGASHVEQLRDNIASLEVRLTPAQCETLEKASAPGPDYPGTASAEVNRMVFGGTNVTGWNA